MVSQVLSTISSSSDHSSSTRDPTSEKQQVRRQQMQYQSSMKIQPGRAQHQEDQDYITYAMYHSQLKVLDNNNIRFSSKTIEKKISKIIKRSSTRSSTPRSRRSSTLMKAHLLARDLDLCLELQHAKEYSTLLVPLASLPLWAEASKDA